MMSGDDVAFIPIEFLEDDTVSDQGIDGFEFNGTPRVVALRGLENLWNLQWLDLGDIASITSLDWLNFASLPSTIEKKVSRKFS
jgi:hypothetical protein